MSDHNFKLANENFWIFIWNIQKLKITLNLSRLFILYDGQFLCGAEIDVNQVGDLWIAALALFLLLAQIVMVCQKVANFDCWIICGMFEGYFLSQFSLMWQIFCL